MIKMELILHAKYRLRWALALRRSSASSLNMYFLMPTVTISARVSVVCGNYSLQTVVLVPIEVAHADGEAGAVLVGHGSHHRIVVPRLPLPLVRHEKPAYNDQLARMTINLTRAL